MTAEFNSNTILTVITMVGTAASYVYLAGVRLARIEVKVDTMWLFQLRRGMSEIHNRALGGFQSPLQLTPEAATFINPLAPELKVFYDNIHGEKLSLVELAIELEKEFGQRISQDVCIKAGIHDAACLIMALSVLRPVKPSDLIDGQCA